MADFKYLFSVAEHGLNSIPLSSPPDAQLDQLFLLELNEKLQQSLQGRNFREESAVKLLLPEDAPGNGENFLLSNRAGLFDLLVQAKDQFFNQDTDDPQRRFNFSLYSVDGQQVSQIEPDMISPVLEDNTRILRQRCAAKICAQAKAQGLQPLPSVQAQLEQGESLQAIPDFSQLSPAEQEAALKNLGARLQAEPKLNTPEPFTFNVLTKDGRTVLDSKLRGAQARAALQEALYPHWQDVFAQKPQYEKVPLPSALLSFDLKNQLLYGARIENGRLQEYSLELLSAPLHDLKQEAAEREAGLHPNTADLQRRAEVLLRTEYPYNRYAVELQDSQMLISTDENEPEALIAMNSLLQQRLGPQLQQSGLTGTVQSDPNLLRQSMTQHAAVMEAEEELDACRVPENFELTAENGPELCARIEKAARKLAAAKAAQSAPPFENLKAGFSWSEDPRIEGALGDKVHLQLYTGEQTPEIQLQGEEALALLTRLQASADEMHDSTDLWGGCTKNRLSLDLGDPEHQFASFRFDLEIYTVGEYAKAERTADFGGSFTRDHLTTYAYLMKNPQELRKYFKMESAYYQDEAGEVQKREPLERTDAQLINEVLVPRMAFYAECGARLSAMQQEFERVCPQQAEKLKAENARMFEPVYAAALFKDDPQKREPVEQCKKLFALQLMLPEELETERNAVCAAKLTRTIAQGSYILAEQNGKTATVLLSAKDLTKLLDEELGEMNLRANEQTAVHLTSMFKITSGLRAFLDDNELRRTLYEVLDQERKQQALLKPQEPPKIAPRTAPGQYVYFAPKNTQQRQTLQQAGASLLPHGLYRLPKKELTAQTAGSLLEITAFSSVAKALRRPADGGPQELTAKEKEKIFKAALKSGAAAIKTSRRQ